MRPWFSRRFGNKVLGFLSAREGMNVSYREMECMAYERMIKNGSNVKLPT